MSVPLIGKGIADCKSLDGMGASDECKLELENGNHVKGVKTVKTNRVFFFVFGR